MSRLLVAGAVLVAVVCGIVVVSFRGGVVADDDTAERVAALETVVSLHDAQIDALQTELALVKSGRLDRGPESTPEGWSLPEDRLFRMDGSSMEPTIHDGDLLLIDENAYVSASPERGDIILFKPPVSSERPYVKRVIGLPGETIEIGTDGYVYVNGQQLDEPYAAAASTECNARTCNPVTVPAGMVYVLGDNRRTSSDSRIWGLLDIDDIIGKAQIV